MNTKAIIQKYKELVKALEHPYLGRSSHLENIYLDKVAKLKNELSLLQEQGETDKYPDLSKLSEERKEESLKEIVNLAAFPLLSAFLAFGLKTHIETMIVNDATKEEYVLTFETASRFRERFKSITQSGKELREELIKFAGYNFKEALRVNYDKEQIALYVDNYLKSNQ